MSGSPVVAPRPANAVERRSEDLASRGKSSSQNPAGRAEDSVEISPMAERLKADRDLLRAIFGGVEEEVSSPDRSLFETAGRSEYLASIAEPTDLSAEATANRILGGIRGYIYGAFRMSKPDATAEDFEEFASEVMRGSEQGMGEAREILKALSVLDASLSEDIGRTESLVREGLDEFFAEERERYASA